MRGLAAFPPVLTGVTGPPGRSGDDALPQQERSSWSLVTQPCVTTSLWW